MRFKLVPDVTSIPFMRIRKLTVSASVLGVIASIALFLMIGLNYGIDFRGGTMLMTETPQSVDVGAYRTVLGGLGVGDVSVTSISRHSASMENSRRASSTVFDNAPWRSWRAETLTAMRVGATCASRQSAY